MDNCRHRAVQRAVSSAESEASRVVLRAELAERQRDEGVAAREQQAGLDEFLMKTFLLFIQPWQQAAAAHAGPACRLRRRTQVRNSCTATHTVTT